MTVAQRDIARKLAALQDAEHSANVSKTCRYFGISRETFYQWRRDHQNGGDAALANRRLGPRENHSRRVPAKIEAKFIEVRKNFGPGVHRLSWYLQRYVGMKVSTGGVQAVLKRNGINRLPDRRVSRAPATFIRYEQEVPGHQVQVDVKFLDVVDPRGKRVRRYQYTAIDDSTRVRALKIYSKHTQANAIAFIDYVRERSPFRIQQVRTDRGHEFQAQFHWHLADLGIQHVYIRPRTPRLNGKVERWHRTDQEEFYQLLEYTDDVDLGAKLAEWKRFYNLARPHTAHRGKCPYEVLREKLSSPSRRQANS